MWLSAFSIPSAILLEIVVTVRYLVLFVVLHHFFISGVWFRWKVDFHGT